MQIAPFLHHIILSSVACPALTYFSKFPHKQHNFWGKITENKTRFDFISHSKKTWPTTVAWICGRSLAGIVGLNPAGGRDVCLL
jgi:hypothetical protein